MSRKSSLKIVQQIVLPFHCWQSNEQIKLQKFSLLKTDKKMCKITVAQKNLLLQFVAKRFSMPTFLLFLNLGKIVLFHIFVIVNPTVHFCGRQSHVNLFLALVLRRSRQLLERLSKALFVFFQRYDMGKVARVGNQSASGLNTMNDDDDHFCICKFALSVVFC